MGEYLLYGVLVVSGLLALLTFLRFFNAFTSMQYYQCKKMADAGMHCSIHRVPRNTLYRYVSMILPVKRYGCQDCGKTFVRLKRIKGEQNNIVAE